MYTANRPGEIMLKPGENIDSWCGKCKRILAHTIEAMVGDKPARVLCNTCKAQHGYKANEPGSSSRQPRRTQADGSAAPRPAGTRVNRYQQLLREKDKAGARSYSIKDTYAEGDVLEHPNFGFGIAIAVKDGTKIEVLFENGPKVLVHGK
jgi:hypothetical protein